MKTYKNTNFSKALLGDSHMRFNKRPRYGVNNSCNNTIPQFQNQIHSSYQYSQNRNSVTDSYQIIQYERGSNRQLYVANSDRLNPNYEQNNQSSPHSQKPIMPSSLSSPSSFRPKQNVTNLPLSQSETLAEKTAFASVIAQNNQHHQQLTSNVINSSNHCGYGKNNFYPGTHNTDFIVTAPSSVFGRVGGINPLMWQTLTSVPPPKSPHQQQPPLSNSQPPLKLPPLPSSGSLPRLPPPPPIPASKIDSPSATVSEKTDQKSKSTEKNSAAKTIVKMKTKRKAMSMRYKLNKSWCEKDALLALKAEETNVRKLQRDIILIIRFPDPEINREIVKCYSPDIESVHFQLNFAPRYCLVHLKPGTNVKKTIDHLSKIPFGTGFLSVEIKQIPHKAHSTKLNEIDPFTLYVGNLPTTVACKTLKEHFPGAVRIDIGFAQRMKYTRYAFIRYQNVQSAIEAYKRMLDAEIGGRTLTIRFRRLTAASEGNKDSEVDNHDVIHEDLLGQTSAPPKHNSPKTCQVGSLGIEQTNRLKNKNNVDTVGDASNNMPSCTETNTEETKKNTTGCNSDVECIYVENDLLEQNNSRAPLSSKENGTSFQESNILSLSIKSDPDDIDSDDVVVRNNLISNFDIISDASDIKHEENNLSLHMEFFEKPNNQNDTCDKSASSDIISLDSTDDDAVSLSSLSTNSLGDFLQTCQKLQTQANNVKDAGLVPMKRRKTTVYTSKVGIKAEPLENNNIASKGSLGLLSKDSVIMKSIKQEMDESNKNANAIRNKHFSEKGISSHRSKIPVRKRKPLVPASNRGNPCSNDTRHMFSNFKTICDFDEFYDTRINRFSQASAFETNIKTESLGISTSSTIENNKKRQEKSNINSTTTTNTFYEDDDDLVPPENLLGSYRPLHNCTKREEEYDDIFSIPFGITRHIATNVNSEDNCEHNNSVNNVTSESNHNEITSDVSNTNALEDSDNDVVITFDNIERQSKQKKFSNLLSTNLFLSKQTDLVSIKHKPTSVKFSTRQISSIIDHDNLDMLYDQLDADSDNEL